MFNFLPGSGVFALAGLIAAAGPVLIHLLNRRRFRVLNWAAMDFSARRSSATGGCSTCVTCS